MTQEEKYKEALLEARAVLEPCLKYSKGKVREALDSIDKELKSFESESEDERVRKALIEYHKQQFENNRDQEVGLFHKDAIAWLEKQKEQKPAWSEEDKEILDGLISLYSNTYSGEKWPWKSGGYITYGDVLKFLKSLRPSWKPSEEQMAALEAATVRYQSTGLESLYEDLKKL